MIKHSSNANTEFMMDYLSLDSINKNIEDLDTQHDKLFYLASYVHYILNSDTTYVKKITQLELANKIDFIHQKVKSGIIKLKPYIYNETKDHLCSELMTRSTAKDYGILMHKLSRKTIGDSVFHNELDKVFHFIFENPKNSEWIKRLGIKGGSTAEMLTMSWFNQNLNGDKIEFVCFLKNLEILDNILFQSALHKFSLQLVDRNGKTQALIDKLNQ